jgi:hypothetical protein
MAAGYVLDLTGLRVYPAALAAIGVVAGATAARSRREDAASPSGDLWLFLGTVSAVAGYLLWRAWPALLPVTIGPDLVHHLQLIHFIQRTGRLPHDSALSPYLLEMMNYTPGAHVLAASLARWLRTDALHVVHPLVVCMVAIKAGMLYIIARDLMASRAAPPAAALAAPVLAFVPVYFLDSLLHFFFLSQVVAETFAIGMLMALVKWARSRAFRDVALMAICAVGVVLSWPVWIGPCALSFVVTLVAIERSWTTSGCVAAFTLGPAVLVLAVHSLVHPGSAGIVTASGAVTAPSIATFGGVFVLLAVAGALLALRDRSQRIVVAFTLAVLLQSVVLGWLAHRAGNTSYYMAFKMMYLAILPAAVLAAVALATMAAWLADRLRARPIAAVVPLVLAVLLVPGRVSFRRSSSPIYPDAEAAGLWVRGNLQPSCVDYFSRHWLTGYWLHLDVLGNPRLSDRMREETFEPDDTATKWILGRGLPYAIVEDLSNVPHEAREQMGVMARFGRTSVVRNLRSASCADSSLPVWRARGG